MIRIPFQGFRCKEDIENRRERRISSGLFQVGANDLDDVVGGFLGRFGIAGHVIADMVFHEFGHEAIYGAASGGEALQGVGARFILVEGAKNAFELADDFFGAVDEVEFFSGSVRHFACLP